MNIEQQQRKRDAERDVKITGTRIAREIEFDGVSFLDYPFESIRERDIQLVNCR